MKTKLFALLLLLFVRGFAHADERLESAVRAFLAKAPHAYPGDELLLTQVDLNGDGNTEILLCYSETDYFKHVGHTWTVLELKDGKWVEPKTLNRNGEIENSSEVVFDENSASFVRLEKYHHYGILSRPAKQWWFTYLENDTLKTLRFEKAADIGMTEDDLRKLADSNKITVDQRPLK